MALKKVIPMDNGFSPEHWVIIGIAYEKGVEKTHIRVAGFKSAAHYGVGGKLTEIVTISLPNNTMPLVDVKSLNTKDNNVIKRAYELIKLIPIFTGAEDC